MSGLVEVFMIFVLKDCKLYVTGRKLQFLEIIGINEFFTKVTINNLHLCTKFQLYSQKYVRIKICQIIKICRECSKS